MKLRICGLLAALSTVLLLTAMPAWAAPPTYSLTPLGLVSTPQSCEGGHLTPKGSGINDSGRVTGTYCLQNGTSQVAHGFLWTRQGGVADLGLPPGMTDPTTSVTSSGINARGQIAGVVSNSSLYDAFVWDRGSFTLFATQAGVTGINDPGQVTGFLFPDGHAFLYSHGEVSDLGVAPGATYSHGEAINNLGHIAGDGGFPAPTPVNYSEVPILWMGNEWHVLGTPYAGDYYASPTSINNYDEIVGISINSTAGVFHAFLWKDGAYTVRPRKTDRSCVTMTAIYTRRAI